MVSPRLSSRNIHLMEPTNQRQWLASVFPREFAMFVIHWRSLFIEFPLLYLKQISQTTNVSIFKVWSKKKSSLCLLQSSD